MIRNVILLAFFGLVLVALPVSARMMDPDPLEPGSMGSANYRVDWSVPVSGGGGEPASSANFAINLTVGQSVVGDAASANYLVGMGYWPGVDPGSIIYLPVAYK